MPFVSDNAIILLSFTSLFPCPLPLTRITFRNYSTSPFPRLFPHTFPTHTSIHLATMCNLQKIQCIRCNTTTAEVLEQCRIRIDFNFAQGLQDCLNPAAASEYSVHRCPTCDATLRKKLQDEIAQQQEAAQDNDNGAGQGEQE